MRMEFLSLDRVKYLNLLFIVMVIMKKFWYVIDDKFIESVVRQYDVFDMKGRNIKINFFDNKQEVFVRIFYVVFYINWIVVDLVKFC